MAPTNETSTRRRGNVNSTSRRNANTNAEVSRNRAAAPASSGSRARGSTHRRPAHGPRPQAPANAPTGPRGSLASRMTYGDSRDQVGSTRDDTSRPRLQRGRPRPQHRAADARLNGAQVPSATPRILQMNSTIHADTNSSSQLFCGSQPTQAADVPLPLSPTTPSLSVSPATTFSPPLRSVRPATTSRPIRMFNAVVAGTEAALFTDVQTDTETSPAPKRPINTYRGKDPIKKVVQNKKLQAIFADRGVPKERRKWKEERMELRIGVSKVMK